MALRKTLGLLASLLFSSTIWADEIKIKPDHPLQYTVVKGDTLWGISAKFLQNPWQWPQLWKNNPQIKNPDLIYPNNTLYFSIVDGQPQLSLSKNISLKPRIRESSIDQSLKYIPSDAITQFLSSPKVVNKYDLANSPYVVDFAGEHLIVGAGDRVYVRSITDPQGLNYTIYREGKPYINPDTQEILGYDAQYIAEATIERAGDPATLFVIKADSEIRKGDRLMPSSTSQFELNYFPRPPKQEIHGNIINVLDGVSQIGRFNVVAIDRGTTDGLKPGHILDIYQRGQIVRDPFSRQQNATVKLPNEIAGVLMVFRTFERVSYALVLEATMPIHILDKIKTP